jgi:hypothetical protein
MIALPWNDPTIRIPPPRQFRTVRAPTATFSINYLSAGTPDGQGATCLAWDASAQAAFSYAASAWASLINSAVPIRINACWANLSSPTTLGYSWSSLLRDFSGAPVAGTWYSYSLADALRGSDNDAANPDFYITYNNGFSWYFGTDGVTPAGQYDFVSVVMHEMGHGLNFAGSMGYGTTRCGASNYGCWGYGTGYPNIYDRFTENGSGQALLNTGLFLNPSAALGSQLTSNNLYFNGTSANAANSGSRVKIYAPATWASGSSYSHLDYSTFAGTANRLMVYAISAASSIHDPGPVGIGLLKDLGWTQSGDNPVPTLTSISPSSATAGGSTFTLTVNGTNFVGGSVVKWNGANRTTTYVSSTQLPAAITAADIATAGTASVTVFNPAPGGGTSNAQTFTINNPVPTTTSISPLSATAGGAAFNLTVNGTNFVNGSTVRWSGSARTTTYVSGSQLTAAITTADIATAGTASVTVFNPTPGGGTSNTQTFTINAANNPVPTTSSLSPSSATAGGAAFTLTVSGTNFINSSVVRWNGVDRTTTYVSTTQLTAAITAADIASAGTASVTVFNPTPGGGTSNAQIFTINNPAPAITSLSPSSATADGGAFTLTVNGTSFVSGSIVKWNGSDRTTTYVSGTQLTAAITAADIATAGTASVTVFNPTPGGGTSNAQMFTINNPTPTTTSLSPSSATAGGAAFTLTVNGTNFVSNSVVRWNGSDRTTTYVSSTQLTTVITAADIAAAGTASVTVGNPAPGGGTSNAQAFTINNPVPTLTSIYPASANAGGVAFTLTVTGTNFISGSVMRWNGADRTTTFVSSTRLTAAITAADVATGGTASVTVFNPTPGGGTSNVQTFTIGFATGTIDPSSGGSVIASDNNGSSRIDFPANAVTGLTTVTYTYMSAPSHALPGGSVALRSFTLEARDNAGQLVTQFLRSYTITLTYTDVQVAALGVSEANLNVAYWNGTAWITMLPCSGCSLDTVNNRVTIVSDHFTEFALAGRSQLFLPLILK